MTLKKKATAIVATTIGAMGSAMAAVPAEVSTALADGKADAMTVAGLALVIIVAIAAFKYMCKGL